ncbi:MAG: carboxy terminal-processing peptidase [Akkermansiaceae bacterium]
MTKKISFLKIFTVSLLASVCSTSLVSAKTDFNEVGKKMLIMLKNSHYEKYGFDEKLGARFFDSYIDRLDRNKQYFLKSDIDGFREKYGSNLHELLIRGESMPAATEIYQTYTERVESRIGYVKQLLDDEESFTFQDDRSTTISRKDAEWFVTDQEVKNYWQGQVGAALLTEILKRENYAKLALEQGKANPLEGKESPGKVIWHRFQRILHSVTSVTEEEIADSLFSAVAASYDPHTDYFSMSEMDRFMSGMQNSFVGIGAMLQAEDDGATKITGIVKGGPAYKGGDLELNDRIVGIDENNDGSEDAMVDIMFERLDRVVDMIRGQEGTYVRFKIEPAGGVPGEIKYIVIKRGKVELKDELASAEIIDFQTDDKKKHRIGFIKLPAFYADFENWATSCSRDIERLINRLKIEEVDGIILDLRHNGGGSLEEVRRMTGFFIGAGPVVQVKNSVHRIEVKESSNFDPIYEGPMVVMIDKTSASASEILAGALQDYNRAVIVGDSSTFGKGTVQQPMQISKMMPVMSDARRAGVLKPTIQKFYRVSGSTTQLKGVESDIVLPSVYEAQEIGEAYLDYALAHDTINRAPGVRELNRANLFLPLLQEKNLERVEASQDFEYINEDITRMIEWRNDNTISLNLEDRKADLAESEERKNLRNKERLARFSKIAEEDKERFRFFRMKLDDVKNLDLVELDYDEDKDNYMIHAKNDLEELEDNPEWPSSLDPVKRESIHILSDLIQATQDARAVGTLQSSNE